MLFFVSSCLYVFVFAGLHFQPKPVCHNQNGHGGKLHEDSMNCGLVDQELVGAGTGEKKDNCRKRS